MPRTIRREYPEYVTGTFTETNGKDVTGAAIQLGLSNDTATPPATWVAPSTVTRPSASKITASLLIDASATPGEYVLWCKVTDSPEVLARPASNDRFKIA